MLSYSKGKQSESTFKGMYSVQKKNYLHKLYEVNPLTGNYTVEINVERYIDVFNDLDNAPLMKRDINHEIKDFLHDCSTDIPLKHRLDLCFNISSDTKSEIREEHIKAAFRTYCSFYLNSYRKRMKDLYFRVIKYGVISFILLSIGFFLEDKIEKGILRNILLEGLTIGGWVFLWQAIVFFTSERKDMSNETKIFRRLLKSQIFFKYNHKS